MDTGAVGFPLLSPLDIFLHTGKQEQGPSSLTHLIRQNFYYYLFPGGHLLGGPLETASRFKIGWFKVEEGTLGYSVCALIELLLPSIFFFRWRVTIGEKHFELRRGQNCLTLA